jgi:hypothetical protein
MGKRRIHMKLSVRGALMNWSNREFEGCFSHDDGRPMSPLEAKSALLDELAAGHEVIPCSPDCVGFDYSGKGCPGHPVEESEQPSTETSVVDGAAQTVE